MHHSIAESQRRTWPTQNIPPADPNRIEHTNLAISRPAFQSPSQSTKKSLRGQRVVQSFGPDGASGRRYTVADAEWLVAMGMVVPGYTQSGVLNRIRFYGQARFPRCAKHRTGTRYSFQEQVGAGHRRWAHKNPPSPDQRMLDGYSSLPHREYMQVYDAIQSRPFRDVLHSVLATN
jgi:hypothetical protein